MKPIISIWLKPRKTFEYLVNLDYNKLCNKLDTSLILISISLSLTSFLREYKNISELGPMYFILIVLFTIFFAFLFIKYVYAYILLLFSKLFQGKANITQIRIALIYSLLPFLVYLIISVGLIITSAIIRDTSILDYQSPLTYYILGIVALRTIIIGLAYYNKYSYGYGLLTILIPTGVVQLLIYF